MSNPLERRPEDKTFTLRSPEGGYEMHKRNTWHFAFPKQPEGDHIFVADPAKYDEESPTMMGSYIWRIRFVELEGAGKWLYLTSKLGEIGVNTIYNDYMSSQDTDLFYQSFDRLPQLGNTRLGRSDETQISWLRYQLDHGQITPEDFA